MVRAFQVSILTVSNSFKPSQTEFVIKTVEFLGQVEGIQFQSLQLALLTKMGSSHEGIWTPGLVPRVCHAFR